MSGKGDKKAANGGGKKDVLKLDIHCERREKTVGRAVVHHQGNVDKSKKKVIISPQPKKDAAAGHKKPDHKSDKKEVKKEPGKTKMKPASVGDKEKRGGGDRKHGNKIVSMPNDRGGVGMTRPGSSTNIIVREVERKIWRTNSRTEKYETSTTTERITSHTVQIKIS